MNRRDKLDQQLKEEYERLRNQGLKAGEAFDAVMEMRVPVKDVFSEDTVNSKLFRKRRGSKMQ